MLLSEKYDARAVVLLLLLVIQSYINYIGYRSEDRQRRVLPPGKYDASLFVCLFVFVSVGPAGGEDVITALTTICNKIWQTGEWPTPWTQSSVITLSRKGNL